MLILYQLFFVYVQMHVCLFKVFSSIFFKSKVFHSDAGRMIEGGASTASGHDAEAFDKALVAAHDARGEGRQRGSVYMTCCVQYRVPQGGGDFILCNDSSRGNKYLLD